MFIEPVDCPQTAACPITDHSMPQLLAGGDAYAVLTQTVGPGIEHQIPVGKAFGGIEPAENVIQFQRAGKFHTLPPCKAWKRVILTDVYIRLLALLASI